MSQNLAPAFKRALPDDIVVWLQLYAYTYVTEARHDWRKAAKLCGITPMHARRIMEAQPEWGLAVDDVLKGLIVEKGEPRLRALYTLSEAISCHPQAELLGIPQPWTREALAEGLSPAAMACIKSVKWGVREVWDDERQCDMGIEVVEAIQWAGRPWDAVLRVLDIEGVRGVKLMPEGAGQEQAKGFGGIQINFIEEPVD